MVDHRIFQENMQFVQKVDIKTLSENMLLMCSKMLTMYKINISYVYKKCTTCMDKVDNKSYLNKV